MIPKSGLYSLTRLTTPPPDLSTPPLYPPYSTPSYIKASPMNPRFMCVFFRPNVITEVSALPLMFYFLKHILILFQSIILPKDNVERIKCQENLMISQRSLLNHLQVVGLNHTFL